MRKWIFPDDMFALCFLCSHPQIKLRAVIITPGSQRQVGLVRHLLRLLERGDVPVGAGNSDTEKECLSGFHYKTFFQINESP